MHYEFYDCKHCAYGTASRELMIEHAAKHRPPPAEAATPTVPAAPPRGLVARLRAWLGR